MELMLLAFEGARCWASSKATAWSSRGILRRNGYIAPTFFRRLSPRTAVCKLSKSKRKGIRNSKKKLGKSHSYRAHQDFWAFSIPVGSSALICIFKHGNNTRHPPAEHFYRSNEVSPWDKNAHFRFWNATGRRVMVCWSLAEALRP